MKLILGDSLQKLKDLPTNTVDAVVTDPPYGLKFMGKNWDYDVPSTDLWREVLRVCKPGAHILSFGGTRTYHRMVVAIEDAGFEIRDQIQWLYGSGFPKSHNIGEGRGTALKPANEPIVLARKPLEKGLTVAANALKWGTGAINVDASRIVGEKRSPEFKNPASELGYHGGSANKNLVGWDKSQGRWPANVLFDEEAARLLDEQSGFLHSVGKYKDPNYQSIPGSFGGGKTKDRNATADNGGGASRFFYVAKASKRERNSGLEGLEVHRYGAGIGQGKDPSAPTVDKNHHPTVKPIKLMEYLCKLITPPEGIILDPFMGSGSTGVAATRLGFQFIGIEREQEYIEIAKRRIEHERRSFASGRTACSSSK